MGPIYLIVGLITGTFTISAVSFVTGLLLKNIVIFSSFPPLDLAIGILIVCSRILDILSRALYWPINNINEQTINIPIAKSRGGKDENITIFFKRSPVTKLTAEIVKVPVINPTIKYIGK